MWNLLEGTNLMGRPAGEDGEYDAHVHLAKVVSLLGPPPEYVIETEQYFRKAYLARPVVNRKGEESRTMNEYWGGPFFDEDGKLTRTTTDS